MNTAEDAANEGKFVVKYVEPYDDVIYFVKTVTVKEMSGPEDGFPYNSIIRETDLRDLKETDLLDYDEDDFEETNLTLYDFIDEDNMNRLNKNKGMPYLPREKEGAGDEVSNPQEIKSSTSDIRELQLTDIANITEIKETDLCSNDDDSSTDVEQRSQEESLSLSSGDTLGYNDEEGDSELWNLDNAESVSVSTDSGIINEECSKLNLDLDLNHFNSAAIKFQDLESDFFDTDCEAMDKSPTDDCFETNRGETKDIVRFQDIESDFFETDCEGGDTNNSDNTVKFQDIESDFFDEEEEISPSSLALKSKTKQTTSSKKDCEIDQQKQILTRLTSAKDKRATMTNSLLRTTIEELERALSNSNTLLIKRDKKIQDLRKHNNELKKSLSEELENSAQLKLLLLEKEAVVSEKEATITSYQTEIERLSQEISDLRLYQLNNVEDFSINCDPSNLDNSVETDLLGDQDITESKNGNKEVTTMSRTQSCSQKETPMCKDKRVTSPNTTLQQKISPCTSMSTTPKGGVSSTKTRQGTLSKSSSFAKSSGSPMSPQSGKNPDNVSSSELHARLQMKFMRDAFFYYMIGFHSDEQINAILAILDYGDKRQDFVLEAHKLKKSGKKFNVSKVSTRGLTFVQDIQPK